MKPETADYLAKARKCLEEAKTIDALPVPEVAAKQAYLAAYHAVHALVFERTGKIIKTHSGVRSMFVQIARDDPLIDPVFPALLGRAYKFKEIADYGVGSQSVVTRHPSSRPAVPIHQPHLPRRTLISGC